MLNHPSLMGTLDGLVHRLHSGQSEARNQLIEMAYEHLEQITQRMLRRFPRVQAADEAGDVLHGALLRLLRALDDVKPGSPKELFALAIGEIKRELVDRARQYSGPAWRFTHDTLRGKSLRSAVASSSEEDDSMKSIALDDWTAFQAAMENLPIEERAVASLIFYHRWTQEQVAELLHLSVRTIQHRLRSAMRMLQAGLLQEVEARSK
jgi:RNA polymerase sigma-70 factor (ECF subfamily)